MIAVVDDVDLARDRDLVLRAQAGDDEAFAQLYHRYHQRLIRFATKRVGDAGDAEEIAQETFARAYRALPTFGGERRFYPWMTVIASRLCIDWLRRTSRLEIGEVADAATIDVDFDRLEREGDVARLGVAMDRICPRHREVLDLREREGWSYQHIADHYKVSLGTVEALIWRARRALRREYEGLASILIGLPLVRRLLPANSVNPARAVATLSTLGTVAVLGLATVTTGPALIPATVPAPLVAAAGAMHTGTTAAAPVIAAPRSTVQGAHATPTTRTVVAAVVSAAKIEVLKLENGIEGQQMIDQEPLHLDLGVIGLGTNPSQILPAAVSTVGGMIHQILTPPPHR
jgi:RNA polymerase sigma-70 factor (ECF subfamily)